MTNLRTNPLVLLIAIALLAAALLIAGCGGGGDGDGATLSDPDPAAKYCPGALGEGDKIPADAFDARELVDLKLADAESEAAKHDCIVRVTFEDGIGVPSTLDLRPDRINVFIENGKVSEIDNVG